ncbi:MAG: Eco57I restriction-modification methylase domain-containing protein [Pseudomonadota bacterium]|nr:Eco57I restriction-modification methylase domain-containing protein [Pseudomonadota bacterium]
MSTVKARVEHRIEQTDVALANQVDALRRTASEALDERRRAEMGQFMTPAPVARLMAAMFKDLSGEIHLLDAGAGVGSLSAALVEEACRHSHQPTSITVNAYEPEATLARQLEQTMALCSDVCARQGIAFSAKVFQEDFIEQATYMLSGNLFSDRIQPRINRAILNPPYRKIHSESKERRLLRYVGIETSNLYTAFVALTVKLLEDGGELVAITPRSFCNGPYFKPFRKLLLSTMTLKHIHIFHARNKAFMEDAVLQENIIFHAVKGRLAERIIISSSICAKDPQIVRRTVHPREVVNPDDPDLVIHITTTEKEGNIALKARSFPCSLKDLGIEVSTGRVVDFRAEKFIREKPSETTVPLIYPGHFEDGFITWPKLNGRKPNALVDNGDSADLLVPSGTYVLVKRFTSKEERRRVVAAVYDPQRFEAKRVGFENHLNYYHINGEGMGRNVAKGLSMFLNSSLVDQYFRQFSGHTQVNATDLRSLRYPTREQLKMMGNRVKNKMPEQGHIDAVIEEVLFS